MKKLNLNEKLSLNKQTIAKLNENEAKSIMGGTNWGTYTTCQSSDCTGRLC